MSSNILPRGLQTKLVDSIKILAGVILNLTGAGIGVIPSGPEQGLALINNVSGSQYQALETFITNSFNGIDLETTGAHLVYLFFDRQMQLDPSMSGRIGVGDANTLGQITQQSMRMPEDGFFYVYTTTLSARSYYFDKLKIRRWKPEVRVKYDYYPYGMLWNNPDLQDEESRLHDHAYQDKEFLFGEYDGTVGLALYDFHARMYDPALCRWLVPDPAAQFANPYLAMGNNPVSAIDPDGKWIHLVIGAVVGAVVNTVTHWDQITAGGEFHWDEFGKAAAIGAVAGTVMAATGGGMTAAAGGVGAGGFATGFGVGAFSTTAGNIILSEGNHVAFGDPRFTVEQYALGAAIGGTMGGVMNGWASIQNGNRFWSGNSTYKTQVGSYPQSRADMLGRSKSSIRKSYGENSAGKVASVEVEPTIKDMRISLGVRENLDKFTDDVVQGSNWKTWGEENFEEAFKFFTRQPENSLHFNLTLSDGSKMNVWQAVQRGAAGPHIDSNITNWELFYIYSNKELLNKTTFYYQNQPLNYNPFQ